MTRQATLSDIPRLVEIRGAVRENRLSDPGRVTLADYEWQIINGPTYVWDDGGLIKGMSVGDPRDGSIWALFVDPAFEGRGIGRVLIRAACTSIAAAGSPHSEAEYRSRDAGRTVLSAQRLAGPRVHGKGRGYLREGAISGRGRRSAYLDVQFDS